MSDASRLRFPDGLTDRHLRRGTRWGSGASPMAILVLGALIVAAMVGLLAGGKSHPQTVVAPEAQFTVSTPRIMRNGIFFETRIAITARAPLADATLLVSHDLWRDMTINTVVPAPIEEESRNGRFALHFGPIAAGETRMVKIDGQVNPPLFAGTRGTLALADGEREIAALPLRITVLP